MTCDDLMQLLARVDFYYVENLSAPPDPALEAAPRRSGEAGLPG